ncbi:MAG TPA: hypothetical protein VNF06_03635 [Candidatus Aquilonibacter sp.]|nr:hypothetical protein [Candidatus Aquilonibacter sp.]
MYDLLNWQEKIIKTAYFFGVENGRKTAADILAFPPDQKDFSALQRDFSKAHMGGARTLNSAVKNALKAGLLNGAIHEIKASKLIK